MPLFRLSLLATAILITGCSSTGSTSQNKTATKIVAQVNPSKVKKLKVSELCQSFEEDNQNSPYSGSVVAVSGTVVAFALNDDHLYTVTLQDEDNEVICVFDRSLGSEIGDGRTVHDGAVITVRGQCFASGLFASTAFSLDGCQIVSK